MHGEQWGHITGAAKSVICVICYLKNLPLPFHQNSGYQLWTISSPIPRRHLATFEDMFDCHNWKGVVHIVCRDQGCC